MEPESSLPQNKVKLLTYDAKFIMFLMKQKSRSSRCFRHFIKLIARTGLKGLSEGISLLRIPDAIESLVIFS